MRVDLHPVYLVSLELHSLLNVDISTKGYYQIRFSSKPSPNVFSSVDICCSEGNTSKNGILPSTVFNATAISRTVELTYVEELMKLGDCFHIMVKLLPQRDFSKAVRLQILVELWSMECHRPPQNELFELDSSRLVEIELNPTRLTAVARTICFDYKAPSVLSLSVFVSLVSIMSQRRKPPPDPAISDGLREYYKNMTSTLLKSMKSIENFIKHYESLLSTVVKFENTDVSLEEATLLAKLESSESPWSTLEITTVDLSKRLHEVFRQFLDLFSRSQNLIAKLNSQYYEWRQRLLGEAFFFNERSLDELKSVLPYVIPELITQLSKSKYLQSFTQYPVSCAAVDSPGDLCSIIFEERYKKEAEKKNIIQTDDISSRISQSSKWKRSGVSKSLRLPKFQSKSFESQSSKSVGKPRLSVDVDSNEFTLVVPKVDQAGGDAESPEASSRSTTDGSETKACFATYNILPAGDTEQMAKLVHLVGERKVVKGKLSNYQYEGLLYSELAFPSLRPAALPQIDVDKKRIRYESPPHLIIFVHGLEGSSDDLMSYKNSLRMTSPETNFQFLMSSANQSQTWADFETLSSNLLGEIHDFCTDMTQKPNRISFIAHSMGGVIVRAMLGLPEAGWIFPLLHTFLTINSPHTGLAYAGRGVNWGVQLVQWWKGSKSMQQLALRDAVSFNDSYIVKLSSNKAFGRFKHILLIGGPNDLFVPHHSALIDQCKTSSKDVSALGYAYREMLEKIHGDLVSSEITQTVVKYSTYHLGVSKKAIKIAGRAAHLAAVEDDVFIEKLLSKSALEYFV
ncbi:unnamed protein product [Auanema sp. JU1783]|nr:unnamed protein product [Auanema sp. JU1783]